MGFGNMFVNGLKGTGWGAAIGAGVGALTMGPFGVIPGMLTGAKIGAAAGATYGLFTPDCYGMNSVYQRPYAMTSLYGGYGMPNTLYNAGYNTGYTSGFGTAAMMGVAATAFAASTGSCFGYPSYGYGYGMASYPMNYGGWGWGSCLW
jgi:hypothetical protein